MILAVAAVLGAVRGVDVTGGSSLAADHLLAQIVHGDIGAFLDDDDLHAGGVAVSELHDHLTIGGNGDTSHDDIALALLNSQQCGVEVHIVHDQLQTQLVSDGLGDLHVDAGVAAVVGGHFIGGECCVGGHDQLALLDGGNTLTVAGLAAGAAGHHAHDQQNTQGNCQNLFHNPYSFSYSKWEQFL